jgi:predicted nucleic acid-binding protein
MMRYLLDTNIVSYYIRRSSPGLHERVKTALIQGTPIYMDAQIVVRDEAKITQEYYLR